MGTVYDSDVARETSQAQMQADSGKKTTPHLSGLSRLETIFPIQFEFTHNLEHQRTPTDCIQTGKFFKEISSNSKHGAVDLGSLHKILSESQLSNYSCIGSIMHVKSTLFAPMPLVSSKTSDNLGAT